MVTEQQNEGEKPAKSQLESVDPKLAEAQGEENEANIRGIKKVNVARASSIMALGTLLSRLLGFARAALLIALIGSLGANDAFQAANNLPNTIYNLLASSVLSAILVPQIVRALQRGNAEEFINRLLTIFTVGIMVLTLVCVAAAPALITLFAAKLDPGWKHLAIVFAYWSLPQVFFYGLYSLWGQLLNAKGSFGPYMWAPVVNNIVGIAGLGLFLVVMNGNQDWANDPGVWTGKPVLILAGTATLGIIVQALVLLIPLSRTGFKLRLVWGLRGHGLGQVSKTAMWAFLSLCVAQLAFLAVSNVAAAANGYAVEHGVVIASTTARNTAFTVFMIPHSTIVTSIVTALFTSMSALVAAGQLAKARAQYLTAQQGVGLVSMYCAVCLFVGAVPLMQVVMPTSSFVSVQVYAQVLTVMACSIPLLAFSYISQRLLLAFNNAKALFTTQVPMTLISLLISGVTYFFLPAKWWVMGTSAAEASANLVSCFAGYLILQRHHLRLDMGRELFWTFGKLVLAGLVAGAAGWSFLHLVGPLSGTEGGSAAIHLVGALAKLCVVGILMLVVYLGALVTLRSATLKILLVPLWGKLRKNRPLPGWISRLPGAVSAEPAPAASNMETASNMDTDRVETQESGVEISAEVAEISELVTEEDYHRLQTEKSLQALTQPSAEQIVKEADMAEETSVRPEPSRETEPDPNLDSAQCETPVDLEDTAEREDTAQAGATETNAREETTVASDQAENQPPLAPPVEAKGTVADEELKTEDEDQGRNEDESEHRDEGEGESPAQNDPTESDPVALAEAAGNSPLPAPAEDPEQGVETSPQTAHQVAGEPVAEQNPAVSPSAHTVPGEQESSSTSEDPAHTDQTTDQLDSAPTGELDPEPHETKADRAQATATGQPWRKTRGELPKIGRHSMPQPYTEPTQTLQIPAVELQQMSLNPAEEPAGKGAFVPEAITAEEAQRGWRQMGLAAAQGAYPLGPTANQPHPAPYRRPGETQIPTSAPDPAAQSETEHDWSAQPQAGPAQAGPIKLGQAAPDFAEIISGNPPAISPGSSDAQKLGEYVGGSTRPLKTNLVIKPEVPHKPISERKLRKAEKKQAKQIAKAKRDTEKQIKREQARQARKAKRAAKLQAAQSGRGAELIDPSRYALRLAGGVTGMGLLLGVGLCFWPVSGGTVDASAPVSKQSGASQSSAPTTATRQVPPKLAALSTVNLEGEDDEHPELLERINDGNENTFWRSRYYTQADFPKDLGIGIGFTLEEKTVVKAVQFTSQSKGGVVELRSLAGGGRPTEGKVLARGTFGETVRLTLPPNTELDSAYLWFPELPKDRQGKNRATVGQITVE